jgi:hypothetical protein
MKHDFNQGTMLHFLCLVIKDYLLSSLVFLSLTVKCLYFVCTSHDLVKRCCFRRAEAAGRNVVSPWDRFVRKSGSRPRCTPFWLGKNGENGKYKKKCVGERRGAMQRIRNEDASSASSYHLLWQVSSLLVAVAVRTAEGIHQIAEHLVVGDPTE